MAFELQKTLHYTNKFISRNYQLIANYITNIIIIVVNTMLK